MSEQGRSFPTPESHLHSVLHHHGIGSFTTPQAAAIGILALGFAVVAAGALFHQTVPIEVDGEKRRLTTLHREPGAMLRDLSVTVHQGDRLEVGAGLVVRRAEPVVVEGDARIVALPAVVDRPADAAIAAGFHLDPHDRVVRIEPPSFPLVVSANAEATLAELPRGVPRSSVSAERDADRFRVLRAVPLMVHDAGLAHEVWTTGATVGEAIVGGGFELVAADRLNPPSATPVQAGLHVWIQRARPASIDIDGKVLQTRTQAATVGALLEQEGMHLESGDRVEPALRAPLGLAPVRVIRIRNETITFEEPIAFDVVHRDASDLPLGQTAVLQAGVPGVRKWSTRIIYEDGREISRQVVRSWIDKPAQPRVIGRGTKLVYADITTDTGDTTTYWAKVRVYVTAYNATSAGKPKGSPGFGITSTGQKATRGIIAVDPSYLPYGTRMYVPGYGIGVAADTGGGLHGPHIDICFDDDEPMSWGSRYVDVYLLTPAPPVERVRHLITPD